MLGTERLDAYNQLSLTCNRNMNKTTYTYNRAKLVTSVTNSKMHTVLSKYEYTYRLDGNQDGKLDHEGVHTSYDYDGLGRLTNETETVPARARGQSMAQTVSKNYTYNTAGNRAAMAVSTTTGGVNEQYTVTYGYDDNNRLLNETKTPVVPNGVPVITAYTHDPNGNQLTKIVNGTNEAETRTYDTFNRLRGVSFDNINSAYNYRPDGLRLSKTVGGITTTHIWDGGNITLELNGSGFVTNRYARGINLIQMEAAGEDKYYLFNAHGDVVQLTDFYGDVIKNYYYDAFGNELSFSADGYRTTGVQSYDPLNPLSQVHKYNISSSEDRPLFDWAKDAYQAYYKDVFENKDNISVLDQNSKSIISHTETEQYKNLEQINPGMGEQGLKGIMNTLRTQSAGIFQSVADIGWTDESYSVRPAMVVDDSIIIAPNSVLTIPLNGKYSRFFSGIAVMEEKGCYVYVKIIADGVELHNELMGIRPPYLYIEVDVTGFNSLSLSVEYDNIDCDCSTYSWDAPMLYLDPKCKPDTNPFRFSGEYWDDCSQTYYLRSRYYDPRISRMLTEDPIKHGLNWYVYANNNPIMYIDPSGLVSVNLVEYAKAQGATVTHGTNSKTGNANVTVSFGGTTATYTDYKSGYIDDSVLNSKFGWSNPYIPTGQTASAFLGVHPVALGHQHTSVIVFAGQDSVFYNKGSFNNKNRHFGMQFATLGAGSIGGKLISGVNREPNDINMDIKVQMTSLGVHDTATIRALFANELHYRTNYTNVNYDLFPDIATWSDPHGYNSNSFAHGLLQSVGVFPKAPSYIWYSPIHDHVSSTIYYSVPGWSKPLPIEYFRRVTR